MTESTPNGYYRLNGGQKRIYWFDHEPIGDTLAAVKYLMSKKKVSASQARKFLDKLKEDKNGID